MQAAAEQHKAAKQTYTWSTPFFDVEFVDIRTRKGNTGTWVFFFLLEFSTLRIRNDLFRIRIRIRNPKTMPSN
jgi:hypothetical protein